jgi:flagellar basal body P-ring formation protein FlgA
LKLRVVALLAAALWFIADTRAQVPARPAAATDPARMLKLYLDAETTGLPGRVEVTVGALDERLRLAPCTNMVPFVPPGSRLWGRGLIGVRCQETAAGAPGWSVLVPVEVKVYGPALVATRPLPAGETPAMDALELQEIELTRQTPGVITDPAVIADAIMVRTLSAGQPLRREHLRARPVVAPGEMVKLVAAGSGFSVTSYGKALSAAAEGQMVRVQADSGRTMTGIARNGKVVEIRL